jgi:predicted dehydrogenase
MSETTASSTVPVRIGFIGVGGMARSHIQQLSAIPGVEITGICDIAPASIARTVERFPALVQTFVTDDYRVLLARDDVDAVVIATPHTQHFSQAMDAVAAKKHVLLEKPMVCRVEDAKTLLDTLSSCTTVFALAYQRHAMGEFKYIRDRIASGELGDVQFLSALQCQQWKKGTKGSWRQDPALSGGGQINDSGSHLLDILLWTTGLTVAQVGAFIDNSGTLVDINSALNVQFTNGAQGTIAIMGDALTWHEDITIWCEKGTFFYRNGTLEFADESGKREPVSGDALPPTHNIDEDFVACLRGEKTPAAPPLCGLRTIEMTEAAWLSGAQNGVPVRMNASA